MSVKIEIPLHTNLPPPYLVLEFFGSIINNIYVHVHVLPISIIMPIAILYLNISEKFVYRLAVDDCSSSISIYICNIY